MGKGRYRISDWYDVDIWLKVELRMDLSRLHV